MKQKLLIGIILFVGALIIIMMSIGTLRSQIISIAGLAVAQTPIQWNNVKDGAAGDNLTVGLLAAQGYYFDGTNFDRVRGSGGAINVNATVSTSGTNFYAIKRDNIGVVSVNIPFGFTSKMVIVETDPSNTDEVAVDWSGGVAVAPAANTAGDDRIKAGRIVTLDDYAVTSISVIAVSGTQIIYVRAFN